MDRYLTQKDRIKFQSLGRDSVGLDRRDNGPGRERRASFNPSVGILLVWTY